MAKNTPAWQLMGLPEQPPVGAWGYVDYGQVWHPGMPRQTFWEGVRSDARWGLWSWHHWGAKVRKDIEQLDRRGPAEHVMLALVWLTDTLYRRLIVHPEG